MNIFSPAFCLATCFFLVGDAPPHMDYANDVKYPVTMAEAKRKGIVVNTIQSGEWQVTQPAWKKIAALGNGEYFHVDDSGNAVTVVTPFDEKLSNLAAELEDTRLYFGDEETRKKQAAKQKASEKLHMLMSPAMAARRSEFNASKSGKANFLGESELVDAVTSGRVDLDDIKTEDLPASMQSMAPEEARAVIDERARKRDELKKEIKELSQSRETYIEGKLEAQGGAADSLDEQIYRMIRGQAAEVGITYDRENAKY